MPIGASDGSYYEDGMDYLTTMTPKQKADSKEISSNESSGDFRSRFGGSEERPLVYINTRPGVEDRRDQTMGVGEQLLSIGRGAIAKPEGSESVPNTPLGNALGGQEIKLTQSVDQESALDSAIHDVIDTTNFFGKMGQAASGSPSRNIINPEFSTQDNSLEGVGKLGDALFGRGQDRYQTWPEKAIRGLYASVVGKPGLPQWAMDPETGEFHTSPEMIEKANDLAGLAVMGPAPVARKLADGTLGSFAGVKAATMKGKLADLGNAQVMEANAAHPNEIYKKTGFFRGADNRWRHEIDDSKSSFNREWAALPEGLKGQEKDITVAKWLSDILDHPELYKAYPELKNLRVVHDPNYRGIAEWNGSNTITMGNRAIESGNQQGILMHEVQHAIQDIEGFAKGGASAKAEREYKLRYTKAVQDLYPEVRGLYEKKYDLGETLTPKEEERFEYLSKVIRTYQKYREAADDAAFEYYMRLAGETEARNTDSRLLLTAEERRNIPPMTTEDIQRQNQIPLDKATLTTAYGVRDPKTGKMIK